MDALILCGGRGRRLGKLTQTTPKPLLPVGGVPFLWHLLVRLKQEGLGRVVLACHYRAERFEQFLETHRDSIPQTQRVVEPKPLGTGGALRHAVEYIQTPTFVAMNGDTWVSQAIGPVLVEHARMERDCTLVAVRADRVEGGARQKGVWSLDGERRMKGFATEEKIQEGWINAGFYVLSRAMVRSWPQGSYSLEDNFEKLLAGRPAAIFCSEGRLLDIGTPSTYERAEEWAF